MGEIRSWTGDDWEEWCLALLTRHHGPELLQRVPAQHRGDLGIEAFSHDGCAYQCYAPQGLISITERYEKQRDKLTDDLNKLGKNMTKLSALLGPVIIETYIFLVPDHESHQIIQHATTKATQLRCENLPFLADNFKVLIHTDHDYAEVRAELLKLPQELIDEVDVSQDEIDSWITSNTELVDNATKKVKKIVNDDKQVAAYVQGLMTTYIEGSKYMDKLRIRYPEYWAYAARCRDQRERRLLMEYPAGAHSDAIAIRDMHDNITKTFMQQVPTLDENGGSTLAWASITDWLIRCPLDFPDGNLKVEI